MSVPYLRSKVLQFPDDLCQWSGGVDLDSGGRAEQRLYFGEVSQDLGALSRAGQAGRGSRWAISRAASR